MKEEKYILKKCIPKGTQIVDLYGDGILFYKIDGAYYPIDLNGGRHPDFVEKVLIGL